MIVLLLTAALAEEPWSPSAEEQSVYEALSVRDPVPSCAEVEALAENDVDTLTAMVDHVELPPWVPMRAAACLLDGHGDQLGDTLDDWVTHPDKRGLAVLVFRRIDDLPEPLALHLAERALSGPHQADARTRLKRSERASIRDLSSAE